MQLVRAKVLTIMITIPVYIKSCSDIDFLGGKQDNYSYAFRKLYASYHKIDDKKYGDYLEKRFGMTNMEFRALQSDVANRIEQTNTNKSNQEERIMDITLDVKELAEEKKSNKNTRSKFKKHNKIKQLDQSLPQNITFGGKEALRGLTKLHNNIQIINREKVVVKKNKALAENQLKINEQTMLWKDKRVLHFYIIGEANQKGNRYFDFDFANKTIIYKPFKGKKIEIKYSCEGVHQKELLKLQELIDGKVIAVTMSISKKQICISFGYLCI